MTDRPVMLILRGIAGTFGGKNYPRGALDEESAKAYAQLRGYEPRVLDVSGEAAVGSKQYKMALAEVRADRNIEAIYGFSGGAYNLAHLLDDLTPDQKKQIKLVVALGAPGNPASRYKGPWETVYHTDPPSGHMDGPRVLLAEAEKARAVMVAMPLRYLIAIDDQLAGHSNEIIEVGYDGPKPTVGPAVRYANLYDQTGTGKYGPYLTGTDTASQYDERVVDPKGAGWGQLLSDQCASAQAAGFDTIEWDNPDGYAQAAVLSAVDFAADHGLKVLAKNPLICDWDPVPYVGHAAVVGIVVEKDDGATPAAYDDLRKKAGKPELPIWFVAFKDRHDDGTVWATSVAKEAAKYSSMWVTMSSDGEYTSSVDVLPVAPPVVAPPSAPSAPTASGDNFPACVKLLLVHEGGNDDDPRDPGGRTSRGIIQREYDVWRREHSGLPSDVWQAPQQTVLDIYRASYWNVMRCNDLQMGVDYAVFDYGVNSGVSRAIKLLQTSLALAVDGAMGPLTIAAANAADPVAFINKYQDARLNFLHGLSTWSVFGRGWGTRVSDVRRDALKMAGGGGAPPAPPVVIYDTLWVQQSLNKLGATPALTEDGKIGPQTRAAIQSFQSAHGLKPDGVAGPLTRAEIVQQLNALDAPSTPLPPGITPVPLPPIVEPPKDLATDEEAHDLGHRIKRTMLAKGYPWFDDQNVVSVEGMDPSGTVNRNRPNAFDDIKMVLDGSGKIISGPFEATTQPGVYWTTHPMASGGAFIIALGPQAVWTPGAYHDHTVWRQADDSSIYGTRDPNATYKRQGQPKSYGNIGVHHHGGYDLPRDNISNAAAGCQVIRSTKEQQQFMNLTMQCPRYLTNKKTYRLTATVLEAKDVLP
jgi:lysozyme family protein